MIQERIGKGLRQVELICGDVWHSRSVMFNIVMLVIVKLSKWWLQLIQLEPLVQWLPFYQQSYVDIGWVIVNLSSTYTVSFILDLNCNCSYCLLAQFVLTILSFSKLDVIEIAHKTTSFQINKPSATLVHIVDLFIYICIALFPGRLFYSIWLYTIQFCLWLCCTHLQFLSLEIQKSSSWLDIHILDNQLQDMTKKKCSQTNVGKIYSEPLAKKKVIHVHIRTQLNVIG
jgi:hypothetical protein